MVLTIPKYIKLCPKFIRIALNMLKMHKKLISGPKAQNIDKIYIKWVKWPKMTKIYENK